MIKKLTKWALPIIIAPLLIIGGTAVAKDASRYNEEVQARQVAEAIAFRDSYNQKLDYATSVKTTHQSTLTEAIATANAVKDEVLEPELLTTLSNQVKLSTSSPLLDAAPFPLLDIYQNRLNEELKADTAKISYTTELVKISHNEWVKEEERKAEEAARKAAEEEAARIAAEQAAAEQAAAEQAAAYQEVAGTTNAGSNQGGSGGYQASTPAPQAPAGVTLNISAECAYPCVGSSPQSYVDAYPMSVLNMHEGKAVAGHNYNGLGNALLGKGPGTPVTINGSSMAGTYTIVSTSVVPTGTTNYSFPTGLAAFTCNWNGGTTTIFNLQRQ